MLCVKWVIQVHGLKQTIAKEGLLEIGERRIFSKQK